MVSTVFAWIVGVALAVIVPTVVVLVAQERARRQAAARFWQRDPVDVYVATTPTDVEALRALAAADGAEAAFVTPGCPLADLFLAELFPRSKDAPKEQT